MRQATLALTVLTVGVWMVLLLKQLSLAGPLSAAVLVPVAGGSASAWIAFFAQHRLSAPARIFLELALLLLGSFFILVVAASRAG